MRGQFTMTYLERVAAQYHRATKAEKGRMLTALCRVCGVHRKYAIRRLATPTPAVSPRPRRPRGPTYGPEVRRVAQAVWEAAGYPWSVRLKAILQLWGPWIRRRFAPSPATERHLLAISPSTLDRALRSKKRALKRRLYGHTKPGSLLKRMIPIQTEAPTVDRPGFVEVDLVAHCGPNASGDFAYSVNLTDLFSGWVETRAVLGKGEAGVFAALTEMRAALPFPLLGLDSDNGGEFINHHLWGYCRREGIQFTRSRSYKKDDQAHIEQKNWTHVRKIIGYDRYDTPAAVAAMNTLYHGDLRIFMNLFQPSVKRVQTVRRGARVTRRYDRPQTPLDRLLASPHMTPAAVAALQARRDRTDPFELAQRVERALDRLWRVARHRPQPPRLADPAHTLEKQAAALARLFSRPGALAGAVTPVPAGFR